MGWRQMKYFFLNLLSEMLVFLMDVWSGRYGSYWQEHEMLFLYCLNVNCVKNYSKKYNTEVFFGMCEF